MLNINLTLFRLETYSMTSETKQWFQLEEIIKSKTSSIVRAKVLVKDVIKMDLAWVESFFSYFTVQDSCLIFPRDINFNGLSFNSLTKFVVHVQANEDISSFQVDFFEKALVARLSLPSFFKRFDKIGEFSALKTIEFNTEQTRSFTDEDITWMAEFILKKLDNFPQLKLVKLKNIDLSSNSKASELIEALKSRK